MDINALRKLVQNMSATALVELVPDYVNALRGTEDIEALRKGLAFLMELAGAKAAPEKKEMDNLPLVNITIGRGLSVSTQTPAGEVQTIEFTQQEVSEALMADSDINSELFIDV